MTEDTQRDSVVMYRNQIEALLACSPRDVKLILAMMRDYGMNGSEVDVPEHLVPLWIMFKFSIDETNRKYAEMCEKRRKAAVIGNKQMRANASNRCQTQANASNSEQTQANATYNENENDNENDISPSNEGDIKNAHARKVLGDGVLSRFNDWLETWQDIHGDGKAMPRHTQEIQMQALLHLPEAIRLDAIEAAIKGCWKNIRDIRHDASSNSTISEKEAKRNATAGSYGRYVPKH